MLAGLKTRLYKYDSVKTVKEHLRPVKHFLFGRTDIYRWLDQIRRARRNVGIKVVFDVGASVGDKAITFLRWFPEATVYCFEPLSSSYRRLVSRTSAHEGRVKPFCLGFYNRNTSIPIRVTSCEVGASSVLPLQGLEDKSIREIAQETVSMRTVDDFVAEHGIGRIDLIKIDVEGVEKEVLEGAIETLAHKVDNVIVEISPLRKGPHSPDHIRVFQCLHDAGFTFVGCDVDYFFTKDPGVLRAYFEGMND